jgi:adenosine deaminase
VGEFFAFIDLSGGYNQNRLPMNPVANIDPALPLCDLHRHLDGSIRLQTVLELAQQHGIDLPAQTPEALRPHIQVVGAETGLMEFIAKFRYLSEVLVDAEACQQIARENVEDALREGIDYIELRFSPWFMAQAHQLDPAEVVAAVIDGTRAGEMATGVKAQLIGILSRTYGPDACMAELEALLAHRAGLVALDLAGDEQNFPACLFRDHFRRARNAGLHVTVHAGEADGADSIWSAIDDLGAERIGHGIRAVEDARLMDYLAQQGIGLEVCLTSNVHTSTVIDLASHPARQLLQHGVKISLNTDDPGISGIDLAHEYQVAAPLAGLDRAMLRQIQLNALDMAFLSAADKSSLRAQKRVAAHL